tara:strand:+ start:86 stop:493 length:408 start_codon:yes stop_codon:yes gene_type:complete
MPITKLGDAMRPLTSKFDIDLTLGEKYEDSLAELLTVGKVEVKAEIDKWRETGNMAIEIRCNGKLSGLSVTKADHWCQVFAYKNEIKMVMIFPVKEIKRIVRELVDKKEARIVMGGDNDKSQLVLIPLDKLKGVA